jgi:site-specific recombinase XerD
MDVELTIDDFKKLLVAQGYAAKTIEGYRKNLNQFQRYLDEQGIKDLRQVTCETIRAYQAVVMAEENAMETKALKLRPVKRLFEHLEGSNQLLLNPTRGLVELHCKDRKIQPVLTLDELRQLLAQPNLSFNCQIRNRAIIGLLYSTGIRLDELLGLSIHDLDFHDRLLYVRRAKGGKQRVVPVGRSALLGIGEYLRHIRPLHARRNPAEQSLFLTDAGQRLAPHCVRQFLREYRLQAKILKPVSPHTLRRTCATHLLQQGVDIRFIQQLLGHQSLKATQIYTRVLPVELKQTHAATHPGIPEASP